ncbi:hypothetical protein M9Y10_004657 [Tritrichomonas musculus]|uniref:Glycosyltransferase 2-like domain-containing protein n=1 Tax=Tritrichomonas musculus TaxID=1915356 RepID=A0ABR2JJ84_9EUKA
MFIFYVLFIEITVLQLRNIIFRFMDIDEIIFFQYTNKQAFQNNLLLLTVGYNNIWALDYQIRLIKKFVLDEFIHIILDNSIHQTISEQIRLLCRKYNVSYFRCVTRSKQTPSRHHASALNWALKNVIPKFNFYIFGFLDHDLFPLYPVSILSRFGSGKEFYGRYQERKLYDMWYLWPGFCFFSRKFFDIALMNMLPGYHGDTGGSLYPYLKFKTKKNGTFAIENIINFTNSELSYQVYDLTWVHTVALSNWDKKSSNFWKIKKELIQNLLDCHLENRLAHSSLEKFRNSAKAR